MRMWRHAVLSKSLSDQLSAVSANAREASTRIVLPGAAIPHTLRQLFVNIGSDQANRTCRGDVGLCGAPVGTLLAVGAAGVTWGECGATGGGLAVGRATGVIPSGSSGIEAVAARRGRPL